MIKNKLIKNENSNNPIVDYTLTTCTVRNNSKLNSNSDTRFGKVIILYINQSRACWKISPGTGDVLNKSSGDWSSTGFLHAKIDSPGSKHQEDKYPRYLTIRERSLSGLHRLL